MNGALVKEALFSSITKTCQLENDQVKLRLPIRKRLLEVYLCELQRKLAKLNQPYLEILYITAYLFAYFGMMRVGEITLSDHVIKAKDIYTNKENKQILVILHSSKTHSRADRPQRIKITGHNNNLTVTSKSISESAQLELYQKEQYNRFCPYKWTQRYLQARGAYLRKDEQFFIFSDGSPLTSYHMRKLLRDTFQDMGLNSQIYDVHSFRIGRATDLFKMGKSIDTIKHLGRWKSNAIYKYLRD